MPSETLDAETLEAKTRARREALRLLAAQPQLVPNTAPSREFAGVWVYSALLLRVTL